MQHPLHATFQHNPVPCIVRQQHPWVPVRGRTGPRPQCRSSGLMWQSPGRPAELASAVERAAKAGRRIRGLGHAHSWTPVFADREVRGCLTSKSGVFVAGLPFCAERGPGLTNKAHVSCRTLRSCAARRWGCSRRASSGIPSSSSRSERRPCCVWQACIEKHARISAVLLPCNAGPTGRR